MNYYADSSVLVKRHIHEAGSARLLAHVAPQAGNTLLTIEVSEVEVVSAFQRRVREGVLAAQDAAQLREDFRGLCVAEYQLVAVGAVVVALACDLLERHALRAYDALQLAAALVANQALVASELLELTFLSADQRLLQAAQAEGLAVEDLSV